ncbi:unnamed protein product [Prorocentrum cordatum]|uniref:Uncharacterized protein n=1 Tax=Prorocentrum cordatum TaxID=2364126 RepID=A0ABN9VY41_9DINO|nr:unnamed protein product [Polarella glacialis]
MGLCGACLSANEAANGAASEAADEAAKEAATEAANIAANRVANEAASRAANEAARKAANETAKEAANGAANTAANAAANNVADDAADEVASKVVKLADSAADESANKAVNKAANKGANKTANEAAKRAKTGSGQAADEGADKVANQAVNEATNKAVSKAANEAAKKASNLAATLSARADEFGTLRSQQKQVTDFLVARGAPKQWNAAEASTMHSKSLSPALRRACPGKGRSMVDNSIEALQFPKRSPDVNPFDCGFWNCASRGLRKQEATYSSARKETRPQFAARLKRATQRVPEAIWIPLAKSTGWRCKAFQRAKVNEFEERWPAPCAAADAANSRLSAAARHREHASSEAANEAANKAANKAANEAANQAANEAANKVSNEAVNNPAKKASSDPAKEAANEAANKPDAAADVQEGTAAASVSCLSHAIGAMNYSDRTILRLHDAVVVRKAVNTAISYHSVTRDCFMSIVEKFRRPKPGKAGAAEGAAPPEPAGGADAAAAEGGGGGRGNSAAAVAAIDAIEQLVVGLGRGHAEAKDAPPLGDGEPAAGGEEAKALAGGRGKGGPGWLERARTNLGRVTFVPECLRVMLSRLVGQSHCEARVRHTCLACAGRCVPGRASGAPYSSWRVPGFVAQAGWIEPVRFALASEDGTLDECE